MEKRHKFKNNKVVEVKSIWRVEMRDKRWRRKSGVCRHTHKLSLPLSPRARDESTAVKKVFPLFLKVAEREHCSTSKWSGRQPPEPTGVLHPPVLSLSCCTQPPPTTTPTPHPPCVPSDCDESRERPYLAPGTLGRKVEGGGCHWGGDVGDVTSLGKPGSSPNGGTRTK